MSQRMNKSEHTALRWLKERFPNDQIKFRYSATPDFIISNGEAYEVKRAYPDRAGKLHVMISNEQLDPALLKYPDAKILLVYDSTVLEYTLKDILLNQINDKIIIHTMKKAKVSVTIRRSQIEWAKKNHINISSVIDEALDNMMKKVKFA